MSAIIDIADHRFLFVLDELEKSIGCPWVVLFPSRNDRPWRDRSRILDAEGCGDLDGLLFDVRRKPTNLLRKALFNCLPEFCGHARESV